jgi:glycine cleavage system H lipoate-binding protein
MQCPFIRETRVRSCRSAGIRKLIPEPSGRVPSHRCASPAWRECPWCTEDALHQTAPTCPLWEESLVQFCAAAPVTRFVPYSEPFLSRCGSAAYRYCELYLDLMRAARHASSPANSFNAPEDLLFTSNHWWLDAAGDGPCHLGIDAFLARLLGPVERVGFATPHGLARPTVVLTVRGVDFSATFPELLPIAAPNLHLRSDPSRLTTEPYSLGWIYEAMIDAGQRRRLRESLLDSAAAARRMEDDARLLNQAIQSRLAPTLAADGGLFAPGLLAAVDREEALVLFNTLCPPLPSGGRN